MHVVKENVNIGVWVASQESKDADKYFVVSLLQVDIPRFLLMQKKTIYIFFYTTHTHTIMKQGNFNLSFGF